MKEAGQPPARRPAPAQVFTRGPSRCRISSLKGTKKAKQWLYPEEFDQLMRCQRVRVRWRQLYALAAYCCLRVGEAGALGVEDVDLERGRVRFHRAVDRATGEVGPTKTEDVRVLDVPKSTIPLLRALYGDVKRAGIDRREALIPTDTSLQLRFHDLRTSGISWLAMLADWAQLDVRDYAGHSEVSTTDLYVRRGRKAREFAAPPFPELPPKLV